MPQFTLDYMPPRQAARRPKQLSWLGLIFLVWGAVSPLVTAALLAGMFRSRTEYHTLHRHYQAQLVRYDSLLTATQEKQLLGRQPGRREINAASPDTLLPKHSPAKKRIQ